MGNRDVISFQYMHHQNIHPNTSQNIQRITNKTKNPASTLDSAKNTDNFTWSSLFFFLFFFIVIWCGQGSQKPFSSSAAAPGPALCSWEQHGMQIKLVSWHIPHATVLGLWSQTMAVHPEKPSSQGFPILYHRSQVRRLVAEQLEPP